MAAETSVASVVGITGLAVGVLGPLAGPYAVIIGCAMLGTLWPLLGASTSGLVVGAGLVLRCTVTAVVLTSVLAVLAERMLGINASELLGPVSFCIGALGNGWRSVIEAMTSALGTLVKGRG